MMIKIVFPGNLVKDVVASKDQGKGRLVKKNCSEV